MPRRTVLYLNHSAQMSGAEASLYSLLEGLRRIDAPVIPVVALPGDGPLATSLREADVPVREVSMQRLPRPRGLKEALASLRYIRRTTPQVAHLIEQIGADLVHSNSTTAHLVGGVAARRTRRPALWHCRDLVSLAGIAPYLASKSSQIVAISECVAASLVKDGVPREKIAVVYNGLDTDLWRPGRAASRREEWGIGAQAFVFGMVGQLVPWKRHADFIEAAAHLVADEGLRHVEFVIVGGDLWGEHNEYVRELHAMVESRALATRFHFAPNQSDALSVLASFDCLVHPTIQEPFGRVLIEAMALEKPVIAMNANGPREIITTEKDGLLMTPGEAGGLAQAMKRVVLDGALRTSLGQQARQTVEQRFGLETHARKLDAIYAQLTA